MLEADHIDSSLDRNRRTQNKSSDLKAEALALFRFLQVGPRGCRYEQASVQCYDRIPIDSSQVSPVGLAKLPREYYTH